jgi:hypothetical protein
MFKSGYVLNTDDKISAAIHNQTPVEVWQNGDIIDYGGIITKHTDETVFINDGYYLKDACEFRVR